LSTRDLQDLKSLTSTQHIGKKREEHHNQAQRQATSRDHDEETHQYAQAGSQKEGKENSSETQLSTISCKGKVFTK
jgi:hypothetical protein